MISEKVCRIIRQAPRLPGVYLFKDAKGGILYVGKAKNLNNRLRSYLNEKGLDYRKRVMMHHVDDVEYIVVASESDAFILENNLIKENQPHYNVDLKDGKTYPYIKVTRETFPLITVTRTIRKDRARYFGPFTSISSVKSLLSRLRAVFPYRHCRTMPRHVCLQYHLGRCGGPCEEKVSPEEYGKNIAAIVDILKGKGKELFSRIEREMKSFASGLEFEKAAQCREQLTGLKQLLLMPDMETAGGKNCDAMALSAVGSLYGLYLLSMREGKVVEQTGDIFESQEKPAHVFEAFIRLHYGAQPSVPPLIIVNDISPGIPLLEEEFEEREGRVVRIRRPAGEEESRLLARCEENAHFLLRKHFLMDPGAYFDDLEELLGISPIDPLDAFDISNYGGEQFTGGCIRLTRKGFDKSLYRSFALQGEHPDDFRMIGEIVERRYKKNSLPHMVLIDGGALQVRFAADALARAGVSLPVIGLAKAEERVISEEGIHLPAEEHEKARLLLMRARDEVHRFTIGYNRRKKRKKALNNPLTEVPGLGKSKAGLVMDFFGNLDGVRRAEISDLVKVPGIGPALAEKIKKHLKNI
ncbi:excinuclease ABC subunit UvrC [Candidatus Mcinerneyibacteriota bacterium]|nr:excinuclease ABC subunit UvrC [Candidatus Mcinerneyibacteriota bacterium]